MQTRFNIQGLAELEKAMLQLGERAGTRIADQGLRAGTGLVVKRAKQLAPVATGELRKSISRRRVRRQQAGSRKWIIGVERPRSRIFHLLEFGTAKMSARPFMRPAMDTEAGNALLEMGRVMAIGIAREARRAPKAPVRPRFF